MKKPPIQSLILAMAVFLHCQKSPGLELDFEGSRLEVVINGTTYKSGDTYDWGYADTKGSLTVSGIVKNPGSSPVTFAAVPQITVGGSHAADIVVTQPTSQTLNAGGQIGFSFQVTPQHVLTRSANLSIASNAESGNYVLNLSGSGYGVALLKDIRSGATGSNPYALTNFNGYVYFAANDGVSGTELWRTDGTPNGTVLFKDFVAGASSGISPTTQSMTVMNGVLYLSGSDATNGNELWKSDGTVAGTQLVANIFLGGTDSDPTFLATLGNEIVFQATQTGVMAAEVYKSNGNAGNFTLVKDINVAGSTSSTPQYFTTMGGNVYFQADDGTNGSELWKSDGTGAGTVMVTNIHTTASTGSFPHSFTAMGGYVYFCATASGEGYELRRTDGTTTSLMIDLYPGSNTGCASSADTVGKLGSTLLFRGNQNTGLNAELYKSDGTIGNATLVKDINPGSGASAPAGFRQLGSFAYFSATDGTNGVELWRTDATDAGTTMVGNIESGGGSSSPANLTAFGGYLIFTATTIALGTELYIYVPPP
ncbi:MAG: ELWxxDGT repeat protein [Turneriella sp.]